MSKSVRDVTKTNAVDDKSAVDKGKKVQMTKIQGGIKKYFM